MKILTSAFNRSGGTPWLLCLALGTPAAVHAQGNGPPSPAPPPADGPLVLDELLVESTALSAARIPAFQITAEELETAERDDVHRVLLRAPGVYVRQEDGFGLRPNIGIRGASSDRSRKITLMEDGVLFAPAPYSAPAAYYFPVMTRMTGVEVTKGPSLLRHGPNTVGGALDVHTVPVPDVNGHHGMLDLSLGSFLYGKAHGRYGYAQKHFGLVAEGVYLRTDGFKDLDGGGNTGFEKSEWMLKGRVQSDPDREAYQFLQLKLGFSNELSRETYLGLTDADFANRPFRRYRGSARGRLSWWRTQMELRHGLELSDHFRLTTVLYRNDFDRTWRRLAGFVDGPTLIDVVTNPTLPGRASFYDILRGARDSTVPGEGLVVANNARRYVSQGVQTEAELTYDTGPVAHHTRFSLRLHQDSVHRDHDALAFNMQSGELVSDGQDPSPTLRNRGTALAAAGFISHAITWKGLRVMPAVRVESVRSSLRDRTANTEQGEQQFEVLPGLLVGYGSGPWSVEGGVHRGYSPVAPGQGEDVSPETSLNYELGGAFSKDFSRVALTGFFSDYTNLLGQCSFSAGCTDDQVGTQFDGGRVHVMGLELLGTHVFESQRWRFPVSGAYTLTRSSFRTSFTSSNPQFGVVSQGDELPYVPTHQLSLSAGLSWNNFEGQVTQLYVSPMKEIAGRGDLEGLETDPYLSTDVVARYRVIDGALLYLKVDNLFFQNTIVARRPFGARPGKPFSIQVGFKLESW